MSLIAVYVKTVSGKYYNTEALEGPNWTMILDDTAPEVLRWDSRQIPDDIDIFAYMLEKHKLRLVPENKHAKALFKKNPKSFWKTYRRKDGFKRSMTVAVSGPVPDEFIPELVSVYPEDKPSMECVIIGGR
jgi:hypothetical protein